MNMLIASILVFAGFFMSGTPVLAREATLDMTSTVQSSTAVRPVVLGARSAIEAQAVVGKSFVLDGTRSHDDGVVRTYSWEQVSGPFKFSTQKGAILTVVPQVAGTYVFELIATDSRGLVTTEATATIVVSAAASATNTQTGESTASPQSGETSVEDRGGAAAESSDEEATNGLQIGIESSSAIQVSAVTVRGWDPEKKKEIVGKAKPATAARTNADLEVFVQNTLLADENVRSIAIDESGVHVAYSMPAKFLGLFATTLTLRTDVDAQGGVKVRFPWTRFLYSSSIDISGAEQELLARITAVANAQNGTVNLPASRSAEVSVQATAQIVELISTVNKAMHDTAKSIIQNIRA